MTDRFKEALDCFVSGSWTDKQEQVIIESLTLATEAEQLRRKLKNTINPVIVSMDELKHAREEAQKDADEMEQLRNNYGSMGVTLAARNSEIEELKAKLGKAKDCIRDILKDDDAQAFKEARKTLEEI